MRPNFSAYPWDRVPRLSRREAALQSVIARWLGSRGEAVGEGGRGRRLAKLVGGEPGSVRARTGAASEAIDPHAAACTVRVGGAEIHVLGSNAGVRSIVQMLLGGPDELAAPRPLGVVEQSIWSLVVATALEDLGVAGQVWPIVDGGAGDRAGDVGPVLDLQLGDIALTVWLDMPDDLELRVPPATNLPTWVERFVLDVPIVVGCIGRPANRSKKC